MGAITVSGLGKAYKQYPTRWSRLAEWVLPRKGPRHNRHWVLRDISFRVEPGEAVGIIGINGAGKSTLLKIITGTTQPTTGGVHISGRVAALLELGMGFHPEFTGRQNVFMAGQLLGLTVEEIAHVMPQIEAFAEIGDYIDQPVRVYSSGMQLRLAFSVATTARPDILVVDEALAVGDAAFQRKCFQRIESYRTAGTTLLFVSHDTETVKKLCARALFIADGHLVDFGAAKTVCDRYERYLFGARRAAAQSEDGEMEVPPELSQFDPSLIASCEMTYGNGKAEILSCWLEDMYGQRVNVVPSGSPFRWRYRVKFNRDVSQPVFAMMLKTREGVALYGVDSMALNIPTGGARRGARVDVEFELQNVLAPGVYYLNCGVRIHTRDGVEFLSRRIDSALLRITQGSQTTASLGLVEMAARLQVGGVETVTA